MKNQMIKLLFVGFMLVNLCVRSGQCDSRRYSGESSEGIGPAKHFDGPVPICFPGDRQCPIG
jgi:hypothetical protein